MGVVTTNPPYEATITSKTGIAIGVEGDYWLSDNLVLQAGYDYGLTNINNYAALYEAFTRDIRASLGILFWVE